ncbi:cytochrome B6 [Massilia sp. Root351]|jgi:cytochrome c peroxidase|nr:cytochrome B6 [Massilia sp. Root351]
MPALALLLATAPVPAAPVNEPIQPVPQSLRQDPAKAALGQRLFNDTRLSANNRVSCATCHDLARGGADSRGVSLGLDGKPAAMNAPSVFNAALNFKQFWNGRADTLEAQIGLVVENPAEMGSRWPDVVRKVQQDAAYSSAFAAAYKDGVTRANIEHALASFERTLITPNSRFDRYLRGEHGAISAAERAGYTRFKQYGCIACHQGVNVGGNMFQKFGVMADYPARGGAGWSAGRPDQGRYALTGSEEDRYVFKVPSLRNVARTAPYFHDGSAATLEQAIDIMFKYQLGRPGSAEDKALIAQFLATLDAQPVSRPGARP